jgi:hypothetical protein
MKNSITETDLAGLALAHLRIHIACGTPSDIRMARILAKELAAHAAAILKELSPKGKNGTSR